MTPFAVLLAVLAVDGGFLHDLAREASVRLEAVIAARAPALVPPVPVAVHWQARKIGAVDLGATLVALTAADLDGDGKAELYAVTPREVLVFAASGRTVREVGKVAFGGELAVPASRDPVGVAVVDGDAVVAATSQWQRGLRVQLHAGRVSAVADGVAGFPVCGARVTLVPGRNYFSDDTLGGRCRDVVDAAGKNEHVAATLGMGGKLAVVVGSEKRELTGVGVAFDVADIDRDGVPEVIFSAASAPGDADTVKVVPFGGDEKKPVFRRVFNGGVAGVVAADVDGDGALDVIVAVRLVGSTKIDLWRLD